MDAENRLGYYSVREYDWYMELFPIDDNKLTSLKLKNDGYPVSITSVKLGERYIAAPLNPGLYIRNV